MIDQDRQSAALTLHRQGVHHKEIARQLRIDCKTVRAILRRDSVVRPQKRSGAVVVDDALLSQLHSDCRGYVQRMHEILTEEHKIHIGYSTLSRLVRSKGLGVAHKQRAAHVPDVPGEEMQQDTSVHQIRLGSSKHKMISCGIYLRYSKMRYVRFYRRFNRFTMKCFIDEALRHWGYCPTQCIIDNTNLAILIGSGSGATMNPEMVNFAANYGFIWKAHAIGHANRKAGTERNFYTIETNFLPGRTFTSLEDLNKQAYEWATVRYAMRPQAKTKLIPAELFDVEKNALVKLPEYISAPYVPHTRLVDQYGYASFDGNFYWIPESVRKTTVTLLQYAHHLSVMDGPSQVARYDIAADGAKNEIFVPQGHKKALPRYTPHNRKPGCEQEEKRLRELHESVGLYLDMIKTSQSGVRKYASFVRGLYTQQQQLGQALFLQALRRAADYKVFEITAIERIAHQIIQIDIGQQPQSHSQELSDEYRSRSGYLDGQFTQENDIDYNL